MLRLSLQLEELGARKRHTYPMRAEIHEHGGLALDIDDASKAIFVVRHQITPLIYLGRFLDNGDIERTTRQVPSPRAGACWFHFVYSTRIAGVRLWPLELYGSQARTKRERSDSTGPDPSDWKLRLEPIG